MFLKNIKDKKKMLLF